MDESMKRLPDSELEVMKVIWDAGGSTTSAQVFEQLHDKCSWKITSILTFLSRLAEKGFLSVEKQGKVNRYTARIGEQEYLEKESRTFLERLCGNSLKALVASLYDSKAIGEKDLCELREFIEEKVKED